MSALDVALSEGRLAALGLMRDRVRLYKQGPDAFDRDSGDTVPGPQSDLYSGQARVKPVATIRAEEVEAGDREVVLHRYQVYLPWSVELPPGVHLLPGDRVEILSSDDPRMAGLTLWVTGHQYSSTATAWRIATEDRS